MTLLDRDRMNMEKGFEEGREEGRMEGREEGISALVLSLRELGISELEVCRQVQKRFHLTEDVARRYLKEDCG
ncbi:MAG TPA: hypothetical protein H9717_08835 [Candidatus Eisenbergiella merdipullorum]|uniref:Uncharacterized protein n=1 Tax=Candidatus Eisenbergiella merdipullorum TaxID=2838553 RepID=A0A9D2I7N6_9FIRM|nr:hypothetical protein [Candidatus Eisenbergiella merdipullorum]